MMNKLKGEEDEENKGSQECKEGHEGCKGQ